MCCHSQNKPESVGRGPDDTHDATNNVIVVWHGNTIIVTYRIVSTCERAVSFPLSIRLFLSSAVVLPEGERRWHTEVVMVALISRTTPTGICSALSVRASVRGHLLLWRDILGGGVTKALWL